MQKIIILLLLTFAFTRSYAQQPAFSFYNQFEGIYNPSSTPSEYRRYDQNLIIGANARTQWTNLPSSPKTQFLRAEYITNSKNTFDMLMGGYILKDQAGPISTTGAYFRLAGIMSKYDPKLGGISAGLQLGAIQYNINTTTLQEKYPTDFLTAQNTHATKPQLSLGVSYYNHFRKGIFNNTDFNTGISITHLAFNAQVFSDDSNEFEFNTNMHYYAYAKIRKAFYDVQALELNTWVRYVKGLPSNIDAHLVFDINEVVSLELGANSAGIGHGGIGINIFDFLGSENNLMHLSYGFNPSFLKAGRAFGNTHEINITYSMER